MLVIIKNLYIAGEDILCDTLGEKAFIARNSHGQFNKTTDKTEH